jgi:predicted nucleotidyltransferase
MKHATDIHRAIAAQGTILRCLTGSGVHGLSISGQDDRDEMGVCIEPPEYVIGLRQFEQYEYHTAWERPGGRANRSGPGDLDETVYSLRKYMRLALNGNPTILLPLLAPDEYLITVTGLGRELRELARPVILSRQAGERFAGYLNAQRRSLLSHDGKGRDVTRPELIEAYGFDTKYCGHIVRLGLQGAELMETGRITLPVPEPERTMIRDIRTGKYPMQHALDLAAGLEQRIRDAVATSPLPEQPDRAAADDWLVSAYQHAWSTWGLKSPVNHRQTGR